MNYTKKSAVQTPLGTCCSRHITWWINYDQNFIVTFPIERWSSCPFPLNLCWSCKDLPCKIWWVVTSHLKCRRRAQDSGLPLWGQCSPTGFSAHDSLLWSLGPQWGQGAQETPAQERWCSTREASFSDAPLIKHMILCKLLRVSEPNLFRIRFHCPALLWKISKEYTLGT